MTARFRAAVDGGARGNPGPAAWGVAVLDGAGEFVEGYNGVLGRATNNVAEYSALLEALKIADSRGARDVEIQSDSELIVRQIQGRYRVKHRDLLPLYQQAKQIIARFASFHIRHVRRNENRHADGLVNAALDGDEAAAAGAQESGAPLTTDPREALLRVLDRISLACERAGRARDEVSLVAVSKTFPPERVRQVMDAGHHLFGENRVQEAVAKIPEVGPGARWHMIGHLQRNKARHAVGVFELIHSVDGQKLAHELNRRAEAQGLVQPILVEVNVAGEESKSGVDEAGLWPLVEGILPCEHLELRGLMTIPPPVEQAELSRPWFVRLRGLLEEARRRSGLPLRDLSMGMTDDFEVAIEEGATLVRVGRAIFGPRL